MGLFSRKSSNKQANGDHHQPSNGDLRVPANMKRANSNPAQHANIPTIPMPKAPDPTIDPAGYLRSIYAVRERSKLVLEKAKRNQLRHFVVDMSKFADTANYVVSIIKVSWHYASLRHATDLAHSVTSTQTINRYRHMADGSTSRWADGRE